MVVKRSSSQKQGGSWHFLCYQPSVLPYRNHSVPPVPVADSSGGLMGVMLPLVAPDPSALVAGFEQTWRAGGTAFRSPHAPFSTAFGSCLCSRGRRMRRMFSWFSAPGQCPVPLELSTEMRYLPLLSHSIVLWPLLSLFKIYLLVRNKGRPAMIVIQSKTTETFCLNLSGW